MDGRHAAEAEAVLQAVAPGDLDGAHFWPSGAPAPPGDPSPPAGCSFTAFAGPAAARRFARRGGPAAAARGRRGGGGRRGGRGRRRCGRGGGRRFGGRWGLRRGRGGGRRGWRRRSSSGAVRGPGRTGWRSPGAGASAGRRRSSTGSEWKSSSVLVRAASVAEQSPPPLSAASRTFSKSPNRGVALADGIRPLPELPHPARARAAASAGRPTPSARARRPGPAASTPARLMSLTVLQALRQRVR